MTRVSQATRDICLLLLVALLPRLYRVTAPLDTFAEWGHAQFALYGYNYLKYGLWDVKLLPTFGIVGGELQAYHHHPMLASLFLAGMYSLLGPTELATHLAAIPFSLATVAVVYLLGRRLWSREAAIWSAALYALAPNTIYMGRTFCMEATHITLLTWGIYFCIRWSDEGVDSKSLWWSATMFALAEGFEVYGVFLTPYFFFLGLRESGRRRWGYWMLGAVPVIVLGLFVLYLSQLHLGDASWSSGAGRYARPWLQWINPDFYLDKGWTVLSFYAFIPPILALFGGLFGLLRARGRLLAGNGVWLGLLLWQPLMYATAGAEMLHRHKYVVIFFAIPIVLLAGYTLSALPKKISTLLFLTFLAASYYQTPRLFHSLYNRDIQAAELLRGQLKANDLLLGLPPYLGFYLKHDASVPYYKFWAGPNQLREPEDLYKRVRHFTEKDSFDRVILFQRFVRDSSHLEFDVDLSKSLEGTKTYRLISPSPQSDPLVWERISESSTEEPQT